MHLMIRQELPYDGNLFSQWVGGRQASSERVSEPVDEEFWAEASRARPTAEEASRALANTPAATSTVVERQEMTRSLGSRIWSRVKRWLGVYTDVTDVMTGVTEVIEGSARLIPEMTQMVDTGGRTLDEIDAVYQATRTSRCSERQSPYTSQAFA